MKKIYIKPGCEVVEIKTQCHLMVPSDVDTDGLDDEKLEYEENGGNPDFAV